MAPFSSKGPTVDSTPNRPGGPGHEHQSSALYGGGRGSTPRFTPKCRAPAWLPSRHRRLRPPAEILPRGTPFDVIRQLVLRLLRECIRQPEAALKDGKRIL